VNKVFLYGTVREKPEVAYTPKGEKIIVFPLWVEDGSFSIDVVFTDQSGTIDLQNRVGNRIMTSGSLVKNRVRSNSIFKLKANKILWMEE
jgi:hypothetical protein